MLSEFIAKKMKEAQYKLLKDGTFFGEITSLRGVWASASNLEGCRHELQEILEDWILLKVRSGKAIRGFTLKVDRRTLVHA